MKWQIRLDIGIRFRAFGRTLYNLEDHEHYDLPEGLGMVGAAVGNKTFATYDAHGVTVSLSLVQTPIPAAPPAVPPTKP